MKKLYFSLLLSVIFFAGNTQTYLDPSDNMVIPSNSWIIFNPGNYTIPDPGNDGLIQIDGKQNIILDGGGVTIDGTNYQGYTIKINNSSYIEIRNFDNVSHFNYVVYITNSDHINIHDNNFSYNKVDSTGWISVWTDYTQALGGGVMMYQTQFAQVNDNVMKYQNDGVALYHCDSITVHANDFAWNTSYGIRMYFTDHCDIQDNMSAHVNRPYTDPSDCAAILLIVSNNNYVVNNDFSYSGDGIFLGQFQYAQILNQNYFGYNECSYSPHNAIEATFADGNIFEYNNCNYSHYGLWLGYSFNSTVRGNEIIGNQHSGIAIDRGNNNEIVDNTISENPTGIELWEGDGIPPYQNQNSGDYFIHDNQIEGNMLAISLKETEHSVIMSNQFPYNRNGIYIFGDAVNDTINNNVFDNTALYHIENYSPDDIDAINNDFIINDESIINCKLYDQGENAASGEVIWQPALPGSDPQFQYGFPDDMAEPDAVWYAYPEACLGYGLHEPTTIEWDYEEKMFGDASVHISTGNGWDIAAMYRPAGDSIASWSFSDQDTLVFWIKSINNTTYKFQFCSVILGNNCGGYYKYTASAASILNPSVGQWVQVKMVLGGVAPWSRSSYGNISLSNIHYVEIHADTWDFGFELWIDGVTFEGTFTGKNETSAVPQSLSATIYPNPATGKSRISVFKPEDGLLQISLFNSSGQLIKEIANDRYSSGYQQFNLDTGLLPVGIYYCRIEGNRSVQTQKIVIQH